MGFVTKTAGVPPIYAKYNASTGQFLVPAKADTPNAIEHIVSKGPNQGEKRYSVAETALTGKLAAITIKEDNAYGKAISVNMAFQDADPSKPTIIVTAGLMGGDKGSVYKSTLGLLEALNAADLSLPLNLSIAHNAKGSEYEQDGKKVVRENASSTIFVRHAGEKDFIRFDASKRPAVEKIAKKDGSFVEDSTDLLAYAKGVFESIHGKIEAQRTALKQLMEKAPQPAAEAGEFNGAGDEVQFGGPAK